MALVAVSRNWVQVNQLEREAVYRFAHEQFPGLCLSRTCTAITRGGLQVSVKRFGRDAELDDEHKRLIREEWGQQFEPQLVWYLKTFGMAVVKPVPHPRLPGEMLPHLVPWNKYTLFFNESSVDQRRYYVAYNDAKYETLDETTQRQVGAPTVQEMLVSNDPSMRVQQNEVKRVVS